MGRKAISGTTLALLMISLVLTALDVQPAKASRTIFIHADGSVGPPSSPIQRHGEIYTFTGNVNDSIVVERDNIVIDGAGYTIKGAGEGIGIALPSRSNVTVKDFKVIEFRLGIRIDNSTYSRVFANTVEDCEYGIYLNFSSHNQVFWNKATNNSKCGICLTSSDTNLINLNVATNNEEYGILLQYSSNNTISANTLTNNGWLSEEKSWGGIRLDDSSYTTVSDNTVVSNNYGISLLKSGNSIVSNNVMAGNMYNFDIYGNSRSHFEIAVSPANIADGKPILYLINSSNTIFDSYTKAATIYVIDSTNVTLRNLVLKNSGKGIFLWNTNNSRIENVTIGDCATGIELRHSGNTTIASNTVISRKGQLGISLIESSDNILSGNTVANLTIYGLGIFLNRSSGNVLLDNIVANISYIGVVLEESSDNILSGNIVENNSYGIFAGCGILLSESPNNSIYENTIANNSDAGVCTRESSNNRFWHNNLLDNAEQTNVYNSQNFWDDSATGNYWSNYNGNDINLDGIGDTSYVIDENNKDDYPLMKPWSRTRICNITWGKEIYEISILGNSTVADFTFNQTERQISFKTTGPNGTAGFCNVTILKELLDAPLEEWTVRVDGETVDPIVIENVTHTFIYFTFRLSTKTVEIKGTNPIDKTQPVANAGQDQTVNMDTTVTFDGSDSTDNIEIASYIWTFIDQTPQTFKDVFPTYIFRTPGTYTITLNVTDLRGNWETDTMTVTVRAVPVWTQSWFWAMILLIPTTSGLSYLGFRYARREGIYERLQKLVRQYVRDEITEEVYEKRLKEIEERSDVDSRARIKEYLDVIMTYERAVAYIDRRKMKNK
jgi:parallel beta-helix repeat protein